MAFTQILFSWTSPFVISVLAVVLASATAVASSEEGAESSEGSLSYHLRKGGHDLNLEDWTNYMNFAERHGWGK